MVKDLLYGLMLKSGNDSAVALAEYIAGDEQGFSVKMNEKVKELGLKDTNFVTPHGLDDSNHYTTAYSLALLTDYALKNETFKNIVNTKSYTVTINNGIKQIENTNELLGNLNGVNGVKTGFTNKAGRCLVTSSSRNNMNIITVVLGADTKKFRTVDSIKLIEYANSFFVKVNIQEKIDYEIENWKKQELDKIYVNKGIYDNFEVELDNNYQKEFTIKKNEENSLKIAIRNVNVFNAPLEKGEIIGNVRIYLKDEIMESVNILNKNYISKRNIMEYFVLFFEELY